MKSRGDWSDPSVDRARAGAILLAVPALVAGWLVGAFLGFHGDGIREAAFLAAICFRGTTGFVAGRMGLKRGSGGWALISPFWGDSGLLYPAATALAYASSRALWGDPFPAPLSQMLWVTVLTTGFGLGLETLAGPVGTVRSRGVRGAIGLVSILLVGIYLKSRS